jgi:hypothetical protein
MDRLLHRQRGTYAPDAGAAVLVSVTPAVGTSWRITLAYGEHNEGAPLNCSWSLAWSGFNRPLTAPAALASGAYNYLHSPIANLGPVFQQPLILRYGQVLTFTAAAKTNGKTVAITLLYDEVIGEDTYGD